MSSRIRLSGLSLVALLLTLACDTSQRAADAEGQLPSPNASILPAPLAPARDLLSAASDAGAPRSSGGTQPRVRKVVAEPISVHRALPADDYRAFEGLFVSLTATWQAPQPNPPHLSAETDPEVVPVLKQEAQPRFEIDLAPLGRLRLAVTSGGLPLPAGTELRSRADYVGHVLQWPDGDRYRLLGPGALRAVFSDGRADVSPLVVAKVSTPKQSTRLGYTTVIYELSTNIGELSLEQAEIDGIGNGGLLLCRLLLELVGVEGAGRPCTLGRLPLRAEYGWQGGGKGVFSVDQVVRRSEIPLERLLVPAPGASFVRSGLPKLPVRSDEQLRSLKLRARGIELQPGAPKRGLLVRNHTHMMRSVYIEGVQSGWVRPGRSMQFDSLVDGHYWLGFGAFLGDAEAKQFKVNAPGSFDLGERKVDAGTNRE